MIRLFEIRCKNHADWLKARSAGLGGSDAAAVIGMNPYMTNIQLFEEKVGNAATEDISDKPYVRYGTEAEPYIRALFALDYPEYQVSNKEFTIYRSEKHPFMQASLDGELVDQNGRHGILEIKTAIVSSAAKMVKWDHNIPDNYYCQVLHYMLVTGYDFAVVCAHLRNDWADDRPTQVRHYHIERSEVEDDLDYLLEKENEFWQHVEAGKRPSLILPVI